MNGCFLSPYTISIMYCTTNVNIISHIPFLLFAICSAPFDNCFQYCCDSFIVTSSVTVIKQPASNYVFCKKETAYPVLSPTFPSTLNSNSLIVTLKIPISKTTRRRIQNPVKHLIWSFLKK